MPTIDKKVAAPKPKKNETTGLGVTEEFYQALAHRTPRDAIEKNFQLLDVEYQAYRQENQFQPTQKRNRK